MYVFRSSHRALCISVPVALLLLSLLTLKRQPTRKYLPDELLRPTLEDSIEQLLTEDDIARASSEAAVNVTLGFEKILALSGRPSWRTRGLAKVSVYTDLQIDVIEPAIPDTKVIEDFLDLGQEKAAKADRGSTLAWLGHLAVLRHMIAFSWETALIVEDDVDFDIAIRFQMQRLASAIQHFTNTSGGASPYGSGWDILWLGHCGESWDRTRSSLQYPDSSRISHHEYIGWKETSSEVIRDRHRLIQWASGPTCTFAYAVTLDGARKVLDLANKGRSTAFDTELNALCVFGRLDCITVTPQLFIHYVPNATSADYVSEVDRKNKNTERPIDDSHLDLAIGQTQNIVNSARCMAMFGKRCLPDAGFESKDAAVYPSS